MNSQAAIQVIGVGKRFEETTALKDITFSVKPAEIFGLIGPDGAGKSTLFRILTTLMLADQGMAFVGGREVVKQYREIRRVVGYMPGRFSLYQDLTVAENLQFFATIFGTSIQENYHLIASIYQQIEPFKNRLAGNLSGGMKQKLALCCALIHKPEVLFLDEPTTGVDAVSRKEFWDMLLELQGKSITILVSTPYMDEAGLCDRIALIDQGQILSINSPTELVDGHRQAVYAVGADNFYQALLFLRDQAFTQSVLPFGEFLHLTLAQSITVSVLLQVLEEAGFTGVSVEAIRPTVEDVFLDLSKREALSAE